MNKNNGGDESMKNSIFIEVFEKKAANCIKKINFSIKNKAV